MAIIIFVFFLIIIIVSNEVYDRRIDSNSFHKHYKDVYRHKPFEYLAYGTTYCKYDIDFNLSQINGYNMGVAPQFLYYTEKMIRESAYQCLTGRKVVYIICGALLFASIGKKYWNIDYERVISKKNLGKEFSYKVYFKKRFPLILHPSLIKLVLKWFIKKIVKSKNTCYTVNYNDNENQVSNISKTRIEELAVKKCNSWCKQFGFEDTLSPNISNQHEEIFKENRKILSRIIEYCINTDLKPIIVVPPLSDSLNQHISDDFLNVVLYNNIAKSNKHNIPILDYRKDKRFQDYRMYGDTCDILNTTSRRFFTQILIEDTNKLLKWK